MSLVRGNFSSVVAIVGGGAVGASLLHELVENLIRGGVARRAEIRLFEKSPTLGRGLAYAMDEDCLLLNQSVQNMSAIHDDRAHFHRWLTEKRGMNLPSGADAYVPRPLFGAYLEDFVRETRARAAAHGLRVRVITDEVVDIDGAQILTRGGEIHSADRIALALGNLPSTSFRHLHDSPHFLPSPYPTARIKALIPRGARVGILGSRLSAIDAALALRHYGHEGEIAFLSRSGLLPCVRGKDLTHDLKYLTRDLIASRESLRLNDIVELMLKEIELEEGVSRDWNETLGLHLTAAERLAQQLGDLAPKVWQRVAVATNEVIEMMWDRLCEHDKRVFRKQFHSVWLAFRVGIPEVNARRIAALLASGQLQIHAGVRDIAWQDGRFVTERFDDKPAPAPFDFMINATGNAGDITEIREGLVANLRARGTIVAHPFGGMRVEFSSGRVIAADGAARSSLYAIGNLTSGTYLLTSALRLNLGHVKRVAASLVDNIFRKEERGERSFDVQSQNSEVSETRELARGDRR